MSKPKWLTGDDLAPTAQKYWKRHAGHLFEDGYLTQDNAEILKSACRCLALAEVSARAIEDEGILLSAKSGAKKSNPAASVLIRAQTEAAKLLRSFGMN